MTDKCIFDLTNIEDLPDALLKELTLTSNIDEKILSIMDGEMNINKLLVSFYRTYGEVKTRQYMVTTLYRMHKKKLIVSVQKKKGTYEITKYGEGLRK